MKFTVRPSKSVRVLGALLCVAVTAAAWRDCRAASSPVSIETVGPTWAQYVAEDAWNQREAAVANHTDQVQDLRLWYRNIVGGRQVEFSRVFQLPPHCERLVAFATYPRDLTPTGKFMGENKLPGIEESFVLTDLAQGHDFPPYARPLPKLNGITAIGRIGGSFDESSATTAVKKLLTNAFTQYVTMQLSPLDRAPDCWYGYSVMSLIVMGEESPELMRPSQTEALLDYVRRGGVMLITANEKLPEMLRGPLAQAAGVTAVGYHRAPTLELPEGKGKTTVNYDRGCLVVELCLDQADAVFNTGQMPLLTRRQFGKGWVFVLAVPLTAANDTIMREVQAARNLQPVLNENGFAAPAKAVLSEIEGRPGPRRVVPTAILLGIGALVLIGGVAAKFRGRGERVWLVLVPSTLVLAAGMHIYSQTRSAREPWLSHVGLVSGLGDGRARVQEVFAYGSPSKQEVTFHADTPCGVIGDIGLSGGLGGKQEVRSGAAMSLPGQVVEPNATRAFYVDDVKSAGDVSARLTFGAKGLEGTIRNSLPSGLTDAVIYAGGKSFKLGNIDVGADKPYAVGAGLQDMLGGDEFTADMLKYELKNRLLRDIQVQASPGRGLNRQVLLMATLNASLLKPMEAQRMGQEGWSVVIWPVGIDPPAKGKSVLLPPGFVETQVRQGQVWGYVKGAISGGSQVGLRAVLPPQVGRLEGVTARLTLRLRASNYTMTVSRMSDDGKIGETIKTIDNPTGIVKIDCPPQEGPAADAGVQFVLRMDQIHKGVDTTSQWTLESADIALEGTVR